MITEITYVGTDGLDFIPSSELAFKNVLIVHREGTEHDIVYGTPGNRKAQHRIVNGFLYFQNPFVTQVVNMGAYDALFPERVNVVYEN